MAEIVTLVNRTKQKVEWIWDGRPYILAPHTKGAYPTFVAEAAKRQNVVMGSEDPFSGEMQYLVGIEEQGDDCSPTEQTKVITRMNRVPLKRNEETIPGHTGVFSVRDVSQSLPLDSSFVKP